jgi:tRNA(fMet)-specific endonuclease VapC
VQLRTWIADRVGQLAVSAISYAEVVIGLAVSAEQTAQAMHFFGQLEIVPFDLAAAQAYARLPFRRGRFDRLIAAHAIALDATLVTANPKDFDDIAQLRLESWSR